MEAQRTSETSVDNYFTRQYIAEDNSELHARRRENLEISQEVFTADREHSRNEISNDDSDTEGSKEETDDGSTYVCVL
jgi:hypothetical protein